MNKLDDLVEKLGNMEAHFYFSKKQQEVLKQIGLDGYDSYYRTFALIDGKVQEYTEMLTGIDGRSNSLYDDAIYLGFGKPHSYTIEIDVENSVINRFVNAKDENDRLLKLEELNLLNEYKTGKKEYIPMWPEIIGD